MSFGRHPLAADIPLPRPHRKAKHAWRTTPRRCDTCKKEPPVCTCKAEPS